MLLTTIVRICRNHVHFIRLCGGVLLLVSCQERHNPSGTIFELLDATSTGVTFANTLTYTEDFNTYLYRGFYNGAGTALADFNNDGFLDLFFCGNQVDNVLYLGDGAFHFTDATTSAGVASPNAWSTGVSVVDINQDGWLDIYVCKSGDPADRNRRNELFINRGVDTTGRVTFEESAAAYGINDLGFSVHALFFDYDLDGDLDMYLSNNSINPSEMVIDAESGIREREDAGGGDKLYRNDGDFLTDVSREAGIYSSAIGFGLGTSVADINRDGWPDIYVANDFFEKDYLYLNNQDGTFTESIDRATSELSLGSMGVDVADLNHDGYPEIFVTEMLPDDEERRKTKATFDDWNRYARKERHGYHRQFPRNTLQLNRGAGHRDTLPRENAKEVTFSEIGRYAGVAATDWSWGVQLVDFDLDGHRDVFVTNGIAKDLLDQDYIDFYQDPSRVRNILLRKGAVIKELIDNIPSQPLANYLFTHRGDLQFQNVAKAWGLDQPSFSSGAAYGDIDNDGDLDLVVSNIDAPPFIYRNNVSHQEKHFISLDVAHANGTAALGAQVTLTVNGQHDYHELFPGRGAMSTVDDRLLIGVGSATVIDTLKIVWPGGAQRVETNVPVDQFLSYAPPADTAANPVAASTPPTATLLTNQTTEQGLTHRHTENDFVDFNREPLLYHMLSNEGPALAVADVNGDGEEDFFIGGAQGTPGTLYVRERGTFSPRCTAVFAPDSSSEDTAALFFDADNDGDSDLLVGSGSTEFSPTSFALVDRLYLNDGRGHFRKSTQLLPTAKPSATSVIVSADIDGDGDLDLFFGGRSVPGAYGVPPASYLLVNDGQGNFQDVTPQRAAELVNVGMVTDAVWMDYDADGDSDLIVAGEWMPLRVFANQRDHFEEVTEVVGLQNTSGLWNVLAAADIDGDGQEDLIAGNLGENTFFRATTEQPVTMYVNDFDGNGRAEQVITTYRGDTAYPVAPKKALTAQLPYLSKKYLKHTNYQGQTIRDIFSEKERASALIYPVVTTQSTIFWNEDGYFSAAALPPEAQWAPLYAICPQDVDGDGRLELVLGGNQHRAKPQTGMYAGSYGTVVQATKDRKLTTVDPARTGLHVTGQVRDIRPITIRDQAHLLVARSDDTTQLYAIGGGYE